MRTSNNGYRALSSRRTNAAITSAPETSPTITGALVHPRDGPSMMPNSNAVRPTTDSIAPTTSRPRGAPSGRGACDSWIVNVPAITPNTTMGTFTRKTEPHQKWSSRNPPAIGPIASPDVPNTTNAPNCSGVFVGGVHRGDDRECRCRDAGAADAHEGARRDELLRRSCAERGEQGRDREQHVAAEKDPATTVPIGERAHRVPASPRSRCCTCPLPTGARSWRHRASVRGTGGRRS